MFTSEAYSRKLWTNHERQSVQARAFRNNQEYILPARFDDTEIPGLRETIGYISLQNFTPTRFAQLILDKISESKGDTPPPAIRSRAFAKKKTATKQKRVSPPGSRTKVNSSGAWILLDDTFFQSRSVSDRTDGEIEITLTVTSPSQEAILRALNAQPYQQSVVAYAHGNDAALAEVQSVIMESTAGKRTCVVKLRPNRRNDSEMDITVNGVTSDQMAENRARRILLDEPWTTTGDHDLLFGLFERRTVDKKMLEAVLPKLWPTYKNKPTEFLRLARLQAVCALKMTNTVEHILELTLGPISKDGAQVRFAGKRRQRFTNRPADVIQIEGKCPLPTG